MDHILASWILLWLLCVKATEQLQTRASIPGVERKRHHVQSSHPRLAVPVPNHQPAAHVTRVTPAQTASRKPRNHKIIRHPQTRVSRSKPWSQPSDFQPELQVPSVQAPVPKVQPARTLPYHPPSVDSSFHEYKHAPRPKMKNYQPSSKMTSSYPPLMPNLRAGSGHQSPMYQAQALYDTPTYQPDVPYNRPPAVAWPPSNQALCGHEVSRYHARPLRFRFHPPPDEMSLEPNPKAVHSGKQISLLPKASRYHLSQRPDGGTELEHQGHHFKVQPENQIPDYTFESKIQSHDTGPLVRPYVAAQDPHRPPPRVPELRPEVQNHHLQYEEPIYKQPWNHEHEQQSKGHPHAPRIRGNFRSKPPLVSSTADLKVEETGI